MQRILLLLLLIPVLSNAQKDTLNQLDSAGKKNGTWIIYYDNVLKQVKDSSKASYYRYTLYAHGFDVCTIYPGGRKNWTLVHTGIEPEHKGKIKQLEGEYIWEDKKGIRRVVTNYKNGYCTIIKVYRSSGALYYVWDFLLERDYQPRSSCYYDFNKKGELARVYYQEKNEKLGEGLYKSGWELWGGDFDCLPLEIDTINRTDTLGGLTKIDVAYNKNGRYRIYFDSNLVKVKDSNKAYFYGYKEYVNGFNVMRYPGVSMEFNFIRVGGNTPQKGKIKALDGEYTWFDKKTGKTRLVGTYKNGYCASYKRFTKDGVLTYVEDFTKNYKGLPNSYTHTDYDEPGGPKRHWMREYSGNVK